MPFKKLNTDRILGVSAMIISVLTLIIFIYQTNIMREQSKLSVKPRLDFTLNQSGNDSIVILQEVIENKGLGPAIIDSIYFIYKGTHHTINPEDFFENNLSKVLEFGYLSQHASFGKGTTLLPGEERAIFTYRIPVTKVDSLFGYLGIEDDDDDDPFPIEVIYTSIYEDEQWLANSEKNEPIKLD